MSKNNPSVLARFDKPNFPGAWWSEHLEFPTTLRIAKYTPVMYQDIPAKTLAKFRPSIRFESLPMVGPLYQGFTMRTKFIFYPYRLAIPKFRRNAQLPWGSIEDVKLPRVQFFSSSVTDPNIINFSLRGSLLDRLGLFSGDATYFNNINTVKDDITITSNVFNKQGSASLLPLLCYWDSWLYTEYNPQDKNILCDTDIISYVSAFDSSSSLNSARVLSTSYFSYDSLRNLVDAFGGVYPTEDVDLGSNIAFVNEDGTYYLRFDNLQAAGTPSNSGVLFGRYPLFTRVATSYFGGSWVSLQNTFSGVGLLPITYKGDYFKSWYSEEGVSILRDYIVHEDATFLSLRLKKRNFDVDMLSLVSGNRYNDYLEYVMDSDLEFKDHPIVVGYDEIDFGTMDVLNQAQTGDGYNGVLGSTASKARQYSSSVRPISFKTKEPGMFMVCTSILPHVVYYNTTQRMHFYNVFADLWHSSYSASGFQQTYLGELWQGYAVPSLHQYGAGGSNTPVSFAKTALNFVPVGWEHMRHFSRLSGGFLNERFRTWTLHYDPLKIGTVVYTGNFDSVGDLEEYFGISITSPRVKFADVATNPDLLAIINSTYVNSYNYSYMFENTNAGDAENFTFQLDLHASYYMPISHKLITNNIL